MRSFCKVDGLSLRRDISGYFRIFPDVLSRRRRTNPLPPSDTPAAAPFNGPPLPAGNSMTIMVACITPADAYLDETLCTLFYAGG